LEWRIGNSGSICWLKKIKLDYAARIFMGKQGNNETSIYIMEVMGDIEVHIPGAISQY